MCDFIQFCCTISLPYLLEKIPNRIKHLTHENKKISHQLDQVLKELSEKEADKQMLQRHLKAAEDEAKHIRQAAEQAKQNNEKLHAVSSFFVMKIKNN